MTTYGYIRVSTEKQTVKNQKLVVKEYCKHHRIHNIQWISETVSGTKSPAQRKLGQLINSAQKGDVIIVVEMSRLGRSLLMILNIIQRCIEKDVKIIAIKEGFELSNNALSKFIASVWGYCAETEHDLIVSRTKAGLERVKKEGKKHIGRPKGSGGTYKLRGKAAFIRRQRLEGKSKMALSKELCVSYSTILRFMKLKGID